MSTTRTPPPKRFSGSNPFDSDSDSETNSKPSRAASAPAMNKVKNTSLPINGENGGRRTGSSSSYASRNKYKNDFLDSGGMENQSLQELEGYAVYKAEETTNKVNGCLRIAEEIREDASRTLVTLHQQGEQITRTHLTAANIEYDLSRGEKLLGSLGGLFSKTWKPKKGREIKGPVLTRDDSFGRRGNHMEQRQKLGLSANPTKTSPNARHVSSETSSALEKVEVEKEKQDDALSDLSNLLDQLKDMAVDMGSEIGRQSKALEHVDDDVNEINNRLKGANHRTRRLLGK